MSGSLAIVIVSFNARDDLARCLDSLTRHPPAVPHDIVVVDNASGDDSVDAVARGWPGVRLIANRTNVGFARATNQGIRASQSELVLLLNGDTIVPPGALDALAAALDADPGLAAVGPRLVDPAGRPEVSFGRMIGPLNELRQKAIVRIAERGPGWLARRIRARTYRTRDVAWVSGACLLVRRAAAEAVGLLDERFFLYGEDVDFCAALRARGGRIRFTAAVEVVHARGRSGRSAPAATAAAYRRSQLAFYDKHHPRWAPVLRLYLRLRRRHPDGHR